MRSNFVPYNFTNLNMKNHNKQKKNYWRGTNEGIRPVQVEQLVHTIIEKKKKSTRAKGISLSLFLFLESIGSSTLHQCLSRIYT